MDHLSTDEDLSLRANPR